MKRLLVLALLALGLSIVLAPAASPAGGSDALGPPCSNITNGDGGYSLAGVVDFTVFLQAPACSFVTYSFYVTDTSGLLLESSNAPDSTDSTEPPSSACTPETPGGGCVHFSIPVTTAPDTVCIYTETAIHGHLADHAPDSSFTCPASPIPSLSIAKGTSPSSGTFG